MEGLYNAEDKIKKYRSVTAQEEMASEQYENRNSQKYEAESKQESLYSDNQKKDDESKAEYNRLDEDENDKNSIEETMREEENDDEIQKVMSQKPVEIPEDDKEEKDPKVDELVED